MTHHLSGTRRWPRLALAALLAAAMLALTPANAWAYGAGDSDKSLVLVRQAIALIVNTPANMAAITDKINDALKAKDKSNVNLSLVQQAKDTLDSNDMHQVRRLLEAAIGARPHTGRADPVPIGNAPPLVGEDTGTGVVADPVPGRGPLSGGDWVLLALALAIGVAGVAASLRLRPHLPHSPTPPENNGGDRPWPARSTPRGPPPLRRRHRAGVARRSQTPSTSGSASKRSSTRCRRTPTPSPTAWAG
jgi:hypothetical protein